MKTLLLIRPVHRRFPISSPFGMRMHPIKKVDAMHNGYDFSCPIGTPISAMHDGKIIVVGYENPQDTNQGYGLRVYQEINSMGNKYILVYAHLDQVHAYEGMYIGEHGLIGYTGNSGASSGPHLHVGARIKDSAEWVPIDFEDEQFCDRSIIKVADIPAAKSEESNVS